MSQFRQNGSGDLAGDAKRAFIRSNTIFTLILMCICLLLWTVAMHADEKDQQQTIALAQAEKARLQMPVKVRDAYERGMSDALEALKDTPDGLQLTQACLSKGMKWEGGMQR